MKIQDILSLKRPSGGKGESKLADMVAEEISGVKKPYGVVLLRSPHVALVSHLDTVHHSEGIQGVSFKGNVIYTPDGECLGADDGAGVYACLEIVKKTNASAIFLFSEECGGKGAQLLLHDTGITIPDRLIEMDRKGELDCVFSNFSGTCSSIAFAKRISHLLGLRPSDKGSFTDVATLCDRSRECVNLSIGYQEAHTPEEYLDFVHVQNMIKRVIKHFSEIEEIPLTRCIPKIANYQTTGHTSSFWRQKRHHSISRYIPRHIPKRIQYQSEILDYVDGISHRYNQCYSCNRVTCNNCSSNADPCGECTSFDCGRCQRYKNVISSQDMYGI